MVRPVFQVYFMHHSHVTGPENQSNCIISGMCSPRGFHFLFFRKWGQKLWSARFWWVINKLEKPGGPLAIFMPYLADLPFKVIFKWMLWRQSHPPAYHHPVVCILDIITNKFTFFFDSIKMFFDSKKIFFFFDSTQ